MTKQDMQTAIREAVKNLPERERIQRISLFGSRLHGTEQPDSDIDLLIEFAKPIGYFGLYDIEQALEKALGSRVDLVTPKAISKHFRYDVLREAQLLYEQP